VIVEDHCGPLDEQETFRRTITGTFTASATGPAFVDIANWKDGVSSSLNVNFIDNISVVPQVAGLDLSVDEISCTAGGTSEFTLSLGAARANKPYVILSGKLGTWPGVRVNGVDVPLNIDSWTYTAFGMINTPYLVNFRGTLDGSGTAAGTFDTRGPVSYELFGQVMYFTCVVLEEPQTFLVIDATRPGHILFVP